MRSLFLGHGSPVEAFTQNRFQEKWQWLGQNMDRPQAVLVLSAHWLTRGLKVTGEGTLNTIHDFAGFPENFYSYQYPAFGSESVISKILEIRPEASIAKERGLDHGAWALLKHIYPDADIPVAQLSIAIDLSISDHIDLAKILSKEFSDDVLFIGSGNVVHNLQRLKAESASEPFCWATEFDQQVRRAVEMGDLERLAELPQDRNAGGPESVPSLDHYLPAIYVSAMTGDNKPQVLIDGMTHGSISMFSFANFELF